MKVQHSKGTVVNTATVMATVVLLMPIFLLKMADISKSWATHLFRKVKDSQEEETAAVKIHPTEG